MKMDEEDIKFLKITEIENPVKIKYIEEFFKDRAYIHSIELQKKINIGQAISIVKFFIVIIVFVCTMVWIVHPLVESYTSNISVKTQNDK